MKIPKDLQKDWEIIKRGLAEIVPEEELLAKLQKSKKSGKPLRVKAGFDPTAPHIHLGWTVPLRKLKHFQDLGHEVVFLFGDFTAMIGDPSGKSETRKPLTREQVLENSKDYMKQLSLILDIEKTTFVYNSEWLGSMSFTDVIHLTSKYTVARMLERDDFEKRYKEEKPISIHEFLYPLAQGYDSVALKADIELGGTDQRFNLLVGRELMRDYGLEPQVTMTVPLLVGTDGVQKMSQSLGNYIGITEPPKEIFGKIMSIPDELITKYFYYCTDLPVSEIDKMQEDMDSGKLNPRNAKAHLGREIITMYHSADAGKNAEEEFNRIFKEKGKPDNIPEFTVPKDADSLWVPAILKEAGILTSTSEARRIIKQGGLKIDDIKVDNPDINLERNKTYLIQAGKRRFLTVHT